MFDEGEMEVADEIDVKAIEEKVVEINLPTTGSKPDTVNYPKDLRRFIGWFPTMILFPASSWYNNIGADTEELIGLIKHGKIIPATDTKPEEVEQVDKNMDLSEGGILKWIDGEEAELIARSKTVNKSIPKIVLTDGNNVLTPQYNQQYQQNEIPRVQTSNSYAIYIRHGNVK